MNKQYVTVFPLRGIQLGDKILELNMTSAEAEEILGAPQLMRDNQWYYCNSELRIDFDADGLVEFIEFIGGKNGAIQPVVYELAAFECNELELYCALERHTSDEIMDEEDGHCYVFKDISVGIYRELAPWDVSKMEKEGLPGEELEQERARAEHWDTLGIGRRGYYKGPEPEAPEWTVYFEQSFFDSFGRSPAKETIVLNKEFVWAGETWYVLAAYVCGKGLVCDYCKKVEPETYLEFRKRWKEWEVNGRDREQMEVLERENPLRMNVQAGVALNGNALTKTCGSGYSYIPDSCMEEERDFMEFRGKWIAQHYGLDLNYAWSFFRTSFLWATKSKPVIHSLSMKFEKDPVMVPGPHFEVEKVGDTVGFAHPMSGICHILTVREYEEQHIDSAVFGNDEMEFPEYCQAMAYTIEPQIEQGHLFIEDCAESDSPKQKKKAKYADGPTAVFLAGKYNLDALGTEQDEDNAVGPDGVIGGACGVTVVARPTRRMNQAQTVCSSLYFESGNKIRWRMKFYEKLQKDVEVELLK